MLGTADGATDGFADGLDVGATVGFIDGTAVVVTEGRIDGTTLGITVTSSAGILNVDISFCDFTSDSALTTTGPCTTEAASPRIKLNAIRCFVCFFMLIPSF